MVIRDAIGRVGEVLLVKRIGPAHDDRFVGAPLRGIPPQRLDSSEFLFVRDDGIPVRDGAVLRVSGHDLLGEDSSGAPEVTVVCLRPVAPKIVIAVRRAMGC